MDSGLIVAGQLYLADAEGALRTAELIDDDFSKLLAFLDVALEQGRSGDETGAAGTVQSALQLASGITGGGHYGDVNILARIAAVQALTKDPSGAAGTLNKAAEIAAAIAEDEAARPDPMDKFSALVSLATARAIMGDVATVLSTADTLEDEPGYPTSEEDKAFFLQLVAMNHAGSGNAQRAASWAESVNEPFRRAFALLGAAEGIISRISVDVLRPMESE